MENFDKNLLASLYDKGFSMQEIANKIGLSYHYLEVQVLIERKINSAY